MVPWARRVGEYGARYVAVYDYQNLLTPCSSKQASSTNSLSLSSPRLSPATRPLKSRQRTGDVLPYWFVVHIYLIVCPQVHRLQRKCLRLFNMEAKKGLVNDALTAPVLDPNIDPALQLPPGQCFPPPPVQPSDTIDEVANEGGNHASEDLEHEWGHHEIWLYIDYVLASLRADARVHPTLSYQDALNWSVSSFIMCTY